MRLYVFTSLAAVVLLCRSRVVRFSDSPAKEDDEKELSLLLVQSLQNVIRLEKYPKSTIDLFVLVLQDDGGAFAAALSAASLALVNAKVEVFDLVSSCSAVRSPL
jgi:ribonuclease PH